LTIATILTTIAQIIGNSYYGIFIYENFKNEFLKGFLNVSVIFVIAIIASISGTLLTKKFAKSLGEAPMLVFGTLLIALMPITFYFNPQLYAIGLATALSVIGGAIVGVAQGLIAERLMDEDELRQYYSSLGFVSALPILLIVAVGAIIVQATSMSLLFLVLGIMLACIVMPLYFVIVLIVDKEYRKQRSQR
jgi:MFS family permease